MGMTLMRPQLGSNEYIHMADSNVLAVFANRTIRSQGQTGNSITTPTFGVYILRALSRLKSWAKQLQALREGTGFEQAAMRQEQRQQRQP